MVRLAETIVPTNACSPLAHPDELIIGRSRPWSPLEALRNSVLFQLATSSKLGLAPQPSRLARGCQHHTKPLQHMTAAVPAALTAFMTPFECNETFASCMYDVPFSLFRFYDAQEKVIAHGMRVRPATSRSIISSQRLTIDLRQFRLHLSPGQTIFQSRGTSGAWRVSKSVPGGGRSDERSPSRGKRSI